MWGTHSHIGGITGRTKRIIFMKAKLIEFPATSSFTWTAQVDFLGSAENDVGLSLE